ncbi:MAG TPA: methyltransferase domain-containing protein [Anaerolineae bacterium]|nr:methyltransferase domain-containing protein [Anaerolineae bacterium]HQI85825.1 methyltransferase domain-containing protein [Anaerolineae bacterium]
MNSEVYIALWQQEEQAPFTGWGFSYLEGRMMEELPPWSYEARAAEVLRGAASVLDMGTGGGERLLQLWEHWPAKVVVTEDYPPNVRVATERLTPLGVRVEVVELTRDGLLPFADAEFDVVLNRQSSFNAAEVLRVLSPGGTFLTQQVDGRWGYDLMAVFGAEPQWPDDILAYNVAWVKDAGLTILTAEEWSGALVFTDVGAIVYYLKVIPWLVPGFSVTTHLAGLLALQARLEKEGELRFVAKKFLIEAQRPV